jgi:hypothetical protein
MFILIGTVKCAYFKVLFSSSGEKRLLFFSHPFVHQSLGMEQRGPHQSNFREISYKIFSVFSSFSETDKNMKSDVNFEI